ncbi:aminotransferase class V-fold PLP-dependent enzyme [Hamadaea tsunoensis]|uniref:aminotransferase class V-fold PLP-dependent enzyme n=1 Tax=Hamadaea tsunoensis TaxID=53368 RepID=UPI0003F575EE|nr:aminotransferase class V-fold PLP-dependent enzyme [Hamadaea tsunoensis]
MDTSWNSPAPWNPPALWRAEPGWLNTASYGLPPEPAWEALQSALEDWRRGRTSWEVWDGATSRARESFARLVGVDASDVAVGAQVSQLLAPVAAGLPDGTTVLVPDIEFTSNVFPWAVHQDRGVRVETAPVEAYLDAIRPGIDVVAFALVQSANGYVADLPAIAAAARSVGALVVVDATQACGWLPFDGRLADVVVVGAYKWMMSPRGTGFAYLAPALRDRLRPLSAGWYAGLDVHDSYYSMPLRLAKDARAFDLSPAWHPWVGTAPALELIERMGVANIHDWDVGLANRFLTALGQAPGNSAIVTVDVPGAEEKLAAAGIRAAVRAGRVRAAFHVYTTIADVDAAVAALSS